MPFPVGRFFAYRKFVEQFPGGCFANQFIQFERKLPVEPLADPVRVPQFKVQKLQNQVDGHDG